MRGLFEQMKKVNRDIKWMHCIIHREALVSKRLSPDVSAIMDNAIKMINFIHHMNHRLFEALCHETDRLHTAIAPHRRFRVFEGASASYCSSF